VDTQHTLGAGPGAREARPVRGRQRPALRDRSMRELISDLARLEDTLRAAPVAPARSSHNDPDQTRLRLQQDAIITELGQRRAARAAAPARQEGPTSVTSGTRAGDSDPWRTPW
jgi:hypothetical protein